MSGDAKRYRLDSAPVGDAEIQVGGHHVERALVEEANASSHAGTPSDSSMRANSR